MRKVTIIIPCYNESENIHAMADALLVKLSNDIFWEVIFVNDGSLDNTSEKINEILKIENNQKKIEFQQIDFSRNFGKEIAVIAGIDYCTGDAAIIIDADLQHPIEKINEMVDAWIKGYMVVIALRTNRDHDSFLIRFFKRGFYRFFKLLGDNKAVDGAGDFRLLDKKVISAFKQYREKVRFNKGIFAELGFKTQYINFEVQNRNAGTTKWNPMALTKYAIQGLVSFSARPLEIIFVVGICFSVFSIGILTYTAFKFLLFGEIIKGYTTLATLITLFSGMQFVFLGILGKYISILFIESKNRPLYIIEKFIKSKI